MPVELVMAAWLVGGAAIGAVIARWWGLLLAAVIPVVFIPAGDSSEGGPVWVYALYLFVPPALVGLAAGIAARRRLDRHRARS